MATATKTKPKAKKRKKKTPKTPPSATNTRDAVEDARERLERFEAELTSGKPKKVAGPFVLEPAHRHFWKAAAKERSRYTCNAVALFPGIPGMAATDGRMLAVMPLQAVDSDTGEHLPLPAPDAFRGADPTEAILLPFELFKKLPARLDYGHTHLELTIIARSGKQFALVDWSPYGNRFQYPLDIEGQFVDFRSVLRTERSHESDVTLDHTILADLGKAIGAKCGLLNVSKNRTGPATLTPTDGEGTTLAGLGLIMPVMKSSSESSS